MTISKSNAIDFFDHFGFIDLQEQKYYPSQRLFQLRRKRIDFEPIDYANMELDKERYLRPPVRNPLFIDFMAGLKSGLTREELLSMGFHEQDETKEFLSVEEGLALCKKGLCSEDAEVMHTLRDQLLADGNYELFLYHWENVRIKTIRDWLSNYRINIE